MRVTPCSTTRSPPGQLAVAPAFRRPVDDDRARRHVFHHLAGDQQGRFLAGNDRGRDDNVAFSHDPTKQFALALVKCLVLRPRVTPSILRVLDLNRQLHKAPTEALDLLLGSRPKSYAEVTAPSRRAVAMAWSPATPAPMTRTRAGVIVPAAVVSMGNNRGNVSAARMTAL